MLNDEAMIQLLARHAEAATEDIVAPASWLKSVPARAASRRRRVRFTTTAIGTVAAAGVAAAIVVPLMRPGTNQATTPTPSTQLVAYDFVLTNQATQAAQQLSCMTGAPPHQPGSSSALSVGGIGDGTTSCIVVQGRRDTSLPADARRVAGHGDDIYLAAPAAGYRLGYRTFADPSGAPPLVLEIAVGQTVPTGRLIDILEAIELAPRTR